MQSKHMDELPATLLDFVDLPNQFLQGRIYVGFYLASSMPHDDSVTGVSPCTCTGDVSLERWLPGNIDREATRQIC